MCRLDPLESRCGLGVGSAKGLLGNKTRREKKEGMGLGRRAIKLESSSDKSLWSNGSSRAKTVFVEVDLNMLTAGGCQLTILLTAGQ